MAVITTTFSITGERNALAGVEGITTGAAPYAYIEWKLEVGSIPATGVGDFQRWQVSLNGPTSSFYALTWASFRVVRGAGATWNSSPAQGRVVIGNSNVFFSIQDRVVLENSAEIDYSEQSHLPGALVSQDILFRGDNNDGNQPECFLDAYVSALVFSRDQADYWPPHTPLWTR